MSRTLFVLLLAVSVTALAQGAKDKAPSAAKPPAAAAAKPAAAPAAPAAAIVANKESKTFHKADCKSAAKIKDANKTTFATAAEATKAGYKACKVCKP
jgi:hypothetical protein